MGRSLGAGKALAALIRVELDLVLSAVERQPSVHVGLEYILAPDVRLVFGSREAVRQVKHRAAKRHRKRDNTVVNTVVENVAKSVTGASSETLDLYSSSGSDPDPLRLPDSSPENLTGNARVETDHRRLLRVYSEEYQAAKGADLKLSKSQWGHHCKVAKRLIETHGIDEACSIVRAAFATPWFVDNACELSVIEKKASSLKGQRRDNSVVKNGAQSGVHAALGFAAEVMAQGVKQ